MKPLSPLKLRAWRPAAAMLAGAVLIGACASSPPAPDAAMQSARQAIASAERTEAAKFAPVELGEARARLVSAEAALGEKRMVDAERFAEKSRADAELASARTASAKANVVNEEMKRSTGTLIEEMQRNTGAKP